jgi:hypothetical protein
LLNEPIPGHGIYWSSVKGKSYPIPIRVLPFDEHQAIDPGYNKPAAKTYAVALKERFAKEMEQFLTKPVAAAQEAAEERGEQETQEGSGAKVDVLSTMMGTLLERFCTEKKDIIEKIKSGGHPYYGVVKALEDMLPPLMADRNPQAYKAVPDALDKALGAGNWQKEGRPSKSKPGQVTQWVVMKPATT